MKQTKQTNNIYYNWDKAYSYNALFHLIITERSLGKTFGKIIKDIKAFFYKGHKSIYLAMFTNEIDCVREESYQYSIFKTVNEINDTIDEIKDLNLEFKLQGRHLLINDKIAFSFYSINEAEKIKKITDLKTYKNINLDECIRFDRYTPNIIDKLLTIYDTVDRRRNTTRLFLMGNAITMFNPYFEGFDLEFTERELEENDGFIHFKERKWLVHISNNKPYQAERAKSAINKLAGKDSKYIKMASEGQFVYDNDQYVCDSITDIQSNLFALMINDKEITFSRTRNGYYFHTKQKATRLLHHKEPSRSSVPIGKERLSKLKALYIHGLIFFENIDIKNNFIKEYIGRYY